MQGRLKISRNDTLKILYENTRIDCGKIEEKYGADQITETEYALVRGSFDKFVQHESWTDILQDRGLNYKRYNPEQKKYNWFRGSMYRNKEIMKFRASEVIRIFGYRKDDKFIVLRIETDHKYSDHG